MNNQDKITYLTQKNLELINYLNKLGSEHSKAKEELHQVQLELNSLIELNHDQTPQTPSVKSSESKDESKDESNEPCTCDSNSGDKCKRHLSRYYSNRGCYWCNYTDCSRFGC
jgi:hypothetical protein